jgi:hypothetical protein
MKVFLISLSLCFLVSIPAYGAVGVDADSSNNCTDCSTLTISHTVAASATLLLCSVSQTVGGTVSGLTWNKINDFTSVTSVDVGTGGSGGTLSLWKLAGPTAGTLDVVITMSATIDSMAAGCTSFTGASATLGVPVTANDPIDSEPLLDGVAVTVPANGMAFGAGFYTYGACTDEVPDTATERYDTCADAGGNNSGAFGVTRTTTGQINWTTHPSGAYEAVIGIPIDPAVVSTRVPHRAIVFQ